MTLSAALAETRRRRLRPESYQSGIGTISLILLSAIGLRSASNLYLAAFLSKSAADAAFFLRANLAWIAIFLAAVAPVIAYRGLAITADARRLSYFPLSGRRRLGAILIAAARGFTVYIPIATAVAAWLSVPKSLKPIAATETLAFLALGLASGATTVAAAWRFRIRDDKLEFLEIGLLLVLLFLNPDFRLPQGEPNLVLLTTYRIGSIGRPWFFTLPCLGAAAAVAATAIIGWFDTRPRRFVSGRDPGLALYRRRLPVGGFALVFGLETVLVLTNPAIRTTVRSIVIGLFAFQWFWFAAFAVRAENDIATAFGPPRPSSRRKIYGKAALAHAALTALPIVVYLTIAANHG